MSMQPVTRRKLVTWPKLPRHDMEPFWEEEIVGMEPSDEATSPQMLLTLTAILAETAKRIEKGH